MASGTEGPRGFFKSIFNMPLVSQKKSGKNEAETSPSAKAPAPSKTSASKSIKSKVTSFSDFPGSKIISKIFNQAKEASRKDAKETSKVTEEASPTMSPAKQKAFNQLKAFMDDGIIYEAKTNNEGRLTQTSKTSDGFTLEISQNFKDPSMPIQQKVAIYITDAGKIIAKTGDQRYEFNSVETMLRAIIKPDEQALNKAAGPKARNEKIKEIRNSPTLEVQGFKGKIALMPPDKDGRDQFALIISDKDGNPKLNANFVVNDAGELQVVGHSILTQTETKDIEISDPEELKFQSVAKLMEAYVEVLSKPSK